MNRAVFSLTALTLLVSCASAPPSSIHTPDADAAFAATLRAAQAKDCSTANELIKQLRSSYATLDIAWYEIAECWQRSSDNKNAQRSIEKAIDDMPRTSAYYPRAVLLKVFLTATFKQHAALKISFDELPNVETFNRNDDLQRYAQVVQTLLSVPQTDPTRKVLLDDLQRRLYLKLLSVGLDNEANSLISTVAPTQRWPDSAMLMQLAQTWEGRKQYDRALVLWQSYYQLSSDRVALFGMRRLQKLMGNINAEETSWQQLVSTATDANDKQQQLLQLGRFYWNRNNNDAAEKQYRLAFSAAPNGAEAVGAYYHLGLLAESLGDSNLAILELKQAEKLSQGSQRRLPVLLRLAWMLYKKQRYSDAQNRYELALRDDLEGQNLPEIFFWLAMCENGLKQREQSSALLGTLASRYPLNYYGLMARKRLTAAKLVPAPLPALPVETQPFAFPTIVPESWSEAEAIQWWRAGSLAGAGYPNLAVTELSAIDTEGKDDIALLQLAQAYRYLGDPYRTLRTARLAIHYDEQRITPTWLPYLFPRPYWELIQAATNRYKVDPYLVLALMRQESNFQPGVVSSADAYGLMQLLPRLAAELSKSLNQPFGGAPQLFEPATNIELGTLHLSRLIEIYNGNLINVLAAYNGSERSVNGWRERFGKSTEARFVEDVTYGETKNYVKRVLANYAVYKALYGSEDFLAPLP